MSDNIRFHSKGHGNSHHTTAVAGSHDSAVDPIASSASPFMGNFNLSGSHVYYDTSVAADTSRTIGYTDFVDKYDPMYTTVRTQSSSWTVLSGDYWSVSSGTQHPNTLTNNVGIGTNVADEKLTVSGNISASGGLSALGGINYFGGNVGIGTTAPEATLHVAGGIHLPNGEYISSDANDGNLRNIMGVDSGDNLLIGDTNYDDIRFNVGGVAPAVTFQNVTGNVGIGTTAPTAQLEVKNSNNSVNQRIRIDAAGTASTSGLVFSNSNLSKQASFYFSAGNDKLYLQMGQAAGNEPIAGSNIMTFASGGKIGINHGGPNHSLTVVGSVSADSFIFPDGTEQTTAATQATTTPIMVSLTEEDLYAQVGSRKLTFVAPFAFTLSKIRAVVSDPPTGSSLSLSAISTGGPLHSDTVDVAAGAYYGDKSSGLLNTSLADGETIWIDLSAVGSTNAGKGVKIYFYR